MSRLGQSLLLCPFLRIRFQFKRLFFSTKLILEFTICNSCMTCLFSNFFSCILNVHHSSREQRKKCGTPFHTHLSTHSYTVRPLIHLCVLFLCVLCLMTEVRGEARRETQCENGDRQDVQKGLESFLTHPF